MATSHCAAAERACFTCRLKRKGTHACSLRQQGKSFRAPRRRDSGFAGRTCAVFEERAAVEIDGSGIPDIEASPKWDVKESGDSVSHRNDLHVVLVEPKIPQNAGNIARTCAATRVALHLVEPLGFDTDSKKLKRAGLDFWPYVVVNVHNSWEAFYEYFKELEGPKRLVAFTKFGKQFHAEPDFIYEKGDWLVFGSEPSGLPDQAHEDIRSSGGVQVRIPMEETHVRCLNLSVCVGIGVYEAVRQLGFRESPTD